MNFIRIPTGFLFEVFHLLSLRFHAGRLIWIWWPAVTAPLCQIRWRSQSCFLGSIKAPVTCWRLPGLGAAFPGTYWQWNHAVTTRPPSIVSLICQREASYQPLSFIQWPWWRPVWVTKTSGRASRKELWEHPWSSDLHCCAGDWLNRTCLFNYAWGDVISSWLEVIHMPRRYSHSLNLHLIICPVGAVLHPPGPPGAARGSGLSWFPNLPSVNQHPFYLLWRCALIIVI